MQHSLEWKQVSSTEDVTHFNYHWYIYSASAAECVSVRVRATGATGATGIRQALHPHAPGRVRTSSGRKGEEHPWQWGT